jgi:predicted DsbA family dithiol-disulfide isomerase
MDTPLPSGRTVAIDVVSDVVCPWCYLGKRRLEKALTLVPEINPVVRWHPFQLDATIPPGGMDRQEYLQRKFGDPGRIAAAHDRLTEMGRREGIDYEFEKIGRSANTIDAHRVVHWAGAAGIEDAMIERLFRAYFSEGLDIGDRAVLARLAGEAGLDRSETAARLATDEDVDTVIARIEEAYRIGVTGVPCFIIDQRYAVIGAEAPETIAEAIRQAAVEPVAS